MSELTDKELHNLALNIVGEELRENGYEFLAVNSTLGKDPQFVCLLNKIKHFIIVRAVKYPANPLDYDLQVLEQIKDHALKFKAETWYAGVGLANAVDYKLPVSKDQNYIVNYVGLIKI